MRPIRAQKVEIRGKVRWRVTIPHKDPKQRKQEWFQKRTDAEKRAGEINANRSLYFRSWYEVPYPDQVLILQAYHQADNSGQKVLDAVLAHKNGPEGNPVRIKDAVEACLKDLKEAGRSKVYLAQFGWTLKKFSAIHGEAECQKIEASHVRDWLRGIKGSPDAKRAYLTRIRTFFAFCAKPGNGWIGKDQNPAKAVAKPERSGKEPTILTVDQVKALLKAVLNCKDEVGKDRCYPEMVAYFGLCLFGGLRPSEARRLQLSHIKADVITIPAEVAQKTKDRRVVPINPALRSCLEFLENHRQGPINRLVPANWRKMFGHVVKASGIAWSGDIMRHSFVSYSNEAFGWQETVKQAGHSLATSLEHYRALTTREEALRFWELRATGPILRL